VLVVGLVLVFVGSTAIKAAVDRPRPPDPLVSAPGSSFPSGHAAHAILYPFLAILAVKLAPGMRASWRTAIVVTGFSLAVVVGLTRVYLHVHYMSDVYGGWALGAAVFAAVGAVAMVVIHLRENPGADDVVGDHPH
jgi:membrane-associated phospholipid phosphatase